MSRTFALEVESWTWLKTWIVEARRCLDTISRGEQKTCFPHSWPLLLPVFKLVVLVIGVSHRKAPGPQGALVLLPRREKFLQGVWTGDPLFSLSFGSFNRSYIGLCSRQDAGIPVDNFGQLSKCCFSVVYHVFFFFFPLSLRTIVYCYSEVDWQKIKIIEGDWDLPKCDIKRFRALFLLIGKITTCARGQKRCTTTHQLAVNHIVP